jgi:hypothetical protein
MSKITGKYGSVALGVTAMSGSLVNGVRYRILEYISSDDFTNVGASSNATGIEFVATGTTPTTWSHSSILIGGVIKITDFELTQKLGVSNVSDSGDAAAGYAVKVAQTFQDWSGKFSGYYIKGVLEPLLGDRGVATLVTESLPTPSKFVGDILITEVSLKEEIAGTNAAKIDVTFEGSGAVVETNS